MGVEDLVGIDWVFTFHERPLWAPPNTIIHSRFYADNTCVPHHPQSRENRCLVVHRELEVLVGRQLC